jgi:hypothetical protein
MTVIVMFCGVVAFEIGKSEAAAVCHATPTGLAAERKKRFRKSRTPYAAHTLR